MRDIGPSIRQVLDARAQRHHLSPNARGSSDDDYLAILSSLAPMRPPAHEFPGTPVVLFDRHEDAAGATPYEVGERVRRARRVFKGRFQGGRVCYVPTRDVPVYLSAYRKVRALSDEERTVLGALEREGPLHKDHIAEVCGVRGKALSTALQRLQQAFLVYEEQLETEWDNPWYSLESEQPSWLDSAPTVPQARLEVLRRFTDVYVATGVEEARDWSGFPLREVREHLQSLVDEGHLLEATIPGWGMRYLVSDWQTVPAEEFVAVLDPGDPLVIAQKAALKREYGSTPVLKYLCVNGSIVGAATGRWGIKPFDVDDVLMPEWAAEPAVRDEVIAKLRRHFPLPDQRILAYRGVPLDGGG